MTTQSLPLVIAGAIESVANPAALPSNEPIGAARYSISNATIYTFNGSTWDAVAGGGGGSVNSVNGFTGTVVLTTTDIAEGTNLYYTTARFDTALATKSTTNLAEGTNLYYTAARFNTAFAAKSTTDLAEGTNLYYTNVRADARITAQKGVANGIASLDSGGKVPVAQLPNSIMDYLGTWNASTNTPTLADGSGSAGDVYVVSVAGTQNLGSGSITFAVGDWIIYSGSIWQKSINSNAVASVNTLTGAVVLTTSNISEGSNLYYTDERVDDRVAVLIQNGTGLTWTYVDGSNTLTGNVSLASFSTSNLSEGSNLYYTDERVDDRVAALLVAGTNITLAYNDPSNTLTISAVAATPAANIRSAEGSGTTTLTISDSAYQVFNLNSSVSRNVDLPTTSITAGAVYTIAERGGLSPLAIRSSAGNSIASISGVEMKLVALVNTPTAAADWRIVVPGPQFQQQTFSTSSPVAATFEDQWSVTLPQGSWEVEVEAYFTVPGSLLDARLLISDTSGNTVGDAVLGTNYQALKITASAINAAGSVRAKRYITVSAATTYYVKSYIDSNAGGTFTINGYARYKRYI